MHRTVRKLSRVEQRASLNWALLVVPGLNSIRTSPNRVFHSDLIIALLSKGLADHWTNLSYHLGKGFACRFSNPNSFREWLVSWLLILQRAMLWILDVCWLSWLGGWLVGRSRTEGPTWDAWKNQSFLRPLARLALEVANPSGWKQPALRPIVHNINC